DFVRARIALLEVALDKLPAGSLDDVMARLDWMGIVYESDIYRDASEDAAWLATLRADVARLAEGSAQSAHPSSVQNGQAQGSADCAHPSSERHLHDMGDLGQDRAAPAAGVHSRHPTASGRRALVMSILDSPETSGLSDREIARRAGVSPTTVGKLRRVAR
ncbi:MAG TPA: hypothetical protein PKD06_18165, partial [Enterovirga sp.]|nr:hypothetical protein [Enterovirga sp.]